jgi:gas vesicle protein
MSNRHHDQDSGHGFTAGVIAGVAIGAGLALLWAPRRGTELRQMIGESADTMRAGLARRIEEVAAQLNHGLEDLHDRVDRYAKAAEAEVRHVHSKATERSS